MSSYLPLFDIVINHSYYLDGRCPCIEFVSSPATRHIIDNAGLVIKKSAAGFVVLYDENRVDALVAYAEDETEPLCFEFKAYASDPQFKGFSEPFDAPVEGALLHFSNRRDHFIADNKIRLHSQEYVSSINYQNSGVPEVKDLLSQKDRLTPPLFVVRLYAKGKGACLFSPQYAITPQSYYLSFKARQTFWKYFLLGTVARKNVYIFDQDGGVEFDFMGETMLPDARSAMVFRSKVAVPLRQRQEFRFQLKEKGPGGDRVLIKRLPVANVGQFGKEVISEQGIVVSEIFINC